MHPSGRALDAPRSGLTWLLGLSAAGWLKRPVTEWPAVPVRGLSKAWPRRATCVRGPWPRDGGASTRGPCWRRLTFELSRATGLSALPVRPMITQGGCTGKAFSLGASALERGVRPHCSDDGSWLA